MPNVLERQRTDTARAVFAVLYRQSSAEGYFKLDAARLSSITGFSRKTTYRVIRLLRRVNLLKLVEYRTGRGRHSLYELNWRKSHFEKKCHPLSRRNKSKFKVHIEYDRVSSVPGDFKKIHSRQNYRPRQIENILWNRKMRAFRNLLARSRLRPDEQRHCVSLIGRHIRKRSDEYALELYRLLAQKLGNLEIPRWVREVRGIYRWFMDTIKWTMACSAVTE